MWQRCNFYGKTIKLILELSSTLSSFFRCMGTLSGEVTVLYIFASLLQMEFTLKVKNLLLLEQILSFKSKPQFGRAMSAREENRK